MNPYLKKFVSYALVISIFLTLLYTVRIAYSKYGSVDNIKYNIVKKYFIDVDKQCNKQELYDRRSKKCVPCSEMVSNINFYKLYLVSTLLDKEYMEKHLPYVYQHCKTTCPVGTTLDPNNFMNCVPNNS